MWLDSAAEAALEQAVREIESQSSVEVVIAIRPSARAWPHVVFIAGSAAAWLTLAYMLFAAPVYPLWTFLVDPLIAAALAGFGARMMPPLVRWLTPRRVLRQAADEAARATFVERGVHRTSQHTGVLVYCALTERVAVVVADSGVTAHVTPHALLAWEQTIAAALKDGGIATAAAIAAIGPTFAGALPRQEADMNEIPDSILHDIDRRPRS
jgi:putative membrane protein